METVAALSNGRPLSRRARVKARVTNHWDLLPNIDGNSAGARRFRDLVQSYVVDLGGRDLISEIKLGLIRQLAATTVMAEEVGARAVSGGEIDVSQMCTPASTVMRLSMRLGFERIAKPVPPLEERLKYLVAHPTPLAIEAEEPATDVERDGTEEQHND